jgi:hypothetical protein
MTDVVYVIRGETGAYDDHAEWYVGYYNTQHAADTACAVLNDMSKQLEIALVVVSSNRAACNALIRQCCVLDDQFMLDYDGTRYTVVRLPHLSELKPITLKRNAELDALCDAEGNGR